MPKALNLEGKIFGRLKVLRFKGSDKRGRMWECKCECGNIIEAYAGALNHGGAKSCGCYKGSRKPPGISALNSINCEYKRSARRRNIEFTLSEKEFKKLIKDNCYFCGQSPINLMRSKGGNMLYNGIDRIDNSKGYIIDNCVTCCKVCNLAKGTTDIESFKSWIVRVYNHLII